MPAYPGHNILKLDNVLVNVRFPTSKTKPDVQYKKLRIRVALRVAEQLRLGSQKIGKYQKNLRFGWRQPSTQSPFQKFYNSSQKICKSRLFQPCPILLDSLLCSKYLVRDCRLERIRQSQLNMSIIIFKQTLKNILEVTPSIYLKRKLLPQIIVTFQNVN